MQLQRAPTSPSTVVLGGGIVGMATAYYLACAADPVTGVKPCVTIVDPASAPCLGASSQCEGVSGRLWFPKQTETLGELSWTLLRELAAKRDGRRSFGYSPLDMHAVFPDGYDPKNPKLPYPVKREEELASLPAWLRTRDGWAAGVMDDGVASARVDAPKFCEFLQSECKDLGVEFLMRSNAVRVHFTPDLSGLSAVDIERRSVTGDQVHRRQIPCQNVVISAGSWSASVFSSLFPSASVRLRMAEKQAVQSWIRILHHPTGSTDGEGKHSQQVWLNALKDNFDFHVSVHVESGELFVGGRIESGIEEPPLPEEIHPSEEEINELKAVVADYIHTVKRESSLRSGRAYMPRTSLNRPLMTKVPWDLLGSGALSEPKDDNGNKGGVFLNFGHDLDGFTLSLASGMVMKQLMLGEEPSVDLTPFQLPKDSGVIQKEGKKATGASYCSAM